MWWTVYSFIRPDRRDIIWHLTAHPHVIMPSYTNHSGVQPTQICASTTIVLKGGQSVFHNLDQQSSYKRLLQDWLLLRLLFHSFHRWNKQLVYLFDGEKQWKRCVSWSAAVNSRWRSGSSSFLSLCRAVLGRGCRRFSAIFWMSERLCNGSWRHEEPLADRTHQEPERVCSSMKLQSHSMINRMGLIRTNTRVPGQKIRFMNSTNHPATPRSAVSFDPWRLAEFLVLVLVLSVSQLFESFWKQLGLLCGQFPAAGFCLCFTVSHHVTCSEQPTGSDVNRCMHKIQVRQTKNNCLSRWVQCLYSFVKWLPRCWDTDWKYRTWVNKPGG